MEKKGLVYLVGAGPGDPGLFTLKGKTVLEKADVIIYDRLVSSRILAFAPSNAELIYVGKISGNHAMSQDEINALLVQKAKAAKVIVRLKGGDPFLFGRGGEEALYLRENGIDFEIVPGITSAISVPAYAGIPVTHRDSTSSLTIVTGHEKPGKHESSINWNELANSVSTVVFLMGVENLEYITESLINAGKDPRTPIALIRWGTLPEQEILTGNLEDIVIQVKNVGFKPPAVIVVGEVVNLREKLSWVENKPLWGKRIIVTRARAQASNLVERIAELGAEPIEFPTITIEREDNYIALHNAFANISNYDWLIFTSVNAVKIFFDELKNVNMDIRQLQNIKICAIGPATREVLEEKGIIVDTMPDEYRAEGIIEELKTRILPNQWVLLPRARGARSIIPKTLKSWGINVNEVHLYKAVAEKRVSKEMFETIINGEVDFITFTSSSTVDNFVNIVGKDNALRINKKAKIACIGPITAKTAEQAGFSIDVMAKNYTIEGLIEAIINYVNSKGGEDNK
ncbi:MAG TPA: uroporphyrinogen-III C-methyltransferase [Syntrophomonadaceae bacterium]|nr:uroporphyrinogen-III C-methyltransferase [Syntrophomonadaceae bacterium]